MLILVFLVLDYSNFKNQLLELTVALTYNVWSYIVYV